MGTIKKYDVQKLNNRVYKTVLKNYYYYENIKIKINIK